MEEALEIAKLYFIPSGIFLAALGASRTEPLKTAVSVLGLVVSGFWIYSIYDISDQFGNLAVSLRLLPLIFFILWFSSTITHARRWQQEYYSISTIQRLKERIRELEGDNSEHDA